MIQRLKIKFIILSMASLLALLTLIVSGMNFLNYRTLVREVDEIISVLSQNKGSFPGFGGIPEMPNAPDPGGNRLPTHMSPELPYESRYFWVLINGDGETSATNLDRIATVDADTAKDYARQALEDGKRRGFIENFRYSVSPEGGSTRITFLDCERRLDFFHTTLYTSITIALAGFLVVLLIVSFFAGRIIRPIAESYEKQKRFITDAGHEIKTPLTIINANTDILEMELEGNESLKDIRQQTKRLSALTNDLVYLARMEEAAAPPQMIEFPISEVAEEEIASFSALAQATGKRLVKKIQPMLSFVGNDKSIRQLISILVDNAIKYSPSDTDITVCLTKQGRTINLSVENKTDAPLTGENIDRVFDRFWRADPSRSSKIGGHGIGLSMARAIVLAHSGKISASSPAPSTFKISAILPSVKR